MMSAAPIKEFSSALPAVRGRLQEDVPLSGLTWFRTGGPADVFFRPADEADLVAFLKGLPSGVPLTVIGVGSNLLVRDGGLRGVVIKLGKPFAGIRIEGSELVAGAGAQDITLAHRAFEAGLTGLEFFRGVPGSVGGAIAMNAGAYGSETADVLVSVRCLKPDGSPVTLGLDEITFGYRQTSLPADWIIVEARFRGRIADKDQIARRMGEIVEAREESQPLRTRTGGSTFKNPAEETAGGMKAWQLIDQAGCRGLRVGGAEVSEKHCNFLINRGGASSADLENLGEQVRRKVLASSGVDLQWEIRRIGEKESGHDC